MNILIFYKFTNKTESGHKIPHQFYQKSDYSTHSIKKGRDAGDTTTFLSSINHNTKA